MNDSLPDGDHFDAVVIGAGPAGSIAARELALNGRRVLLLDKARFPRYKVCGGCLNLRALNTLARAGLPHLPARLGGVPLDRFILAAGGRRATIPLPGGYAISRERLDTALAQAAQDAAALFHDGVRATPGPVAGKFREVFLRSGDRHSRVFAKTVIMAGGLGQNLGEIPVTTTPNSRIGAGVLLESGPDWCRPGAIYMACGRGGYVGLARVEENRLKVGAAFDTEFVKSTGGLAAAARQVMHEAGFPTFLPLQTARWRGTPLLTRRAQHVSAQRLAVAGDAAGYVEPFTGEGIGWALEGGLAVARSILDTSDGALPERVWTDTYRRLVVSNQRVCQWFAWGLRRPFAVRLAVRLLAIAPQIANSVVQDLSVP